MRRILSILAAAISLLLFTAAAAGWVRSYWVFDTVGRVGDRKVVVVISRAGSLVLSSSAPDPENEEPGPRPYYVWHRNAPRGGPAGIIVKGKVVRLGADAWASGFGSAVVPHWLLVLITLPGGCWVIGRMAKATRAMVRRNYGHCPACGYNLTGNVTGVCPECGNPR